MKKIYVSLTILILFIISILIIFINYIFKLYPIKYLEIIDKYASCCNIDKTLILSIINVESSFDNYAVSKSEAIGLMQLKIATASDMANLCDEELNNKNDLFNVEINIKYGTMYLRYLLDYYDQNFNYAICAYNAGLGNVDNWLNDTQYTDEKGNLIKIPFNETNNYLKKVNKNLKIYNIYEKLNLIK